MIEPLTDPSHAIFLSYASQDAKAAQRICEALRAAGIEVWFDQSELRGGDAWDQSIRKQIKACALFIPIISTNAHARVEGFFRLEWKLAVDRSHLMTTNRAFLLPVVIDETREDDENVPDRFKDIHWSRLPGGDTPPAFVERVQRLVFPDPSDGPTMTASRPGPASVATALARGQAATRWRSKRALPIVLAIVAAGAVAYFVIDKFWVSKHQAPPPTSLTASTGTAPAAFAPPPRSIAVLPFVNMSGDKDQEYFSEGLTEELLNSLARINELQVAARTSSFSFQGEHPDIATVAHKLNVGSVLEGSVRRSGRTIRITAQLINGVTGFHLWSQTYDRDLKGVLELQTEIATAVASALKITLLGDEAARIEVGGTRNPAAFDAYLRAANMYFLAQSDKGVQAAIAGYSEAIRLDPEYAVAYADRSIALANLGSNYLDKAREDARNAIGRAPTLAAGHLALANLAETSLDFTLARDEYERSRALEPGNARVLAFYGGFAVEMGESEAGLRALRRSVTLDPLNYNYHFSLGTSLVLARRYDEAVVAIKEAQALAGSDVANGLNSWLGYAYYGGRDHESARTACEKAGGTNGFFCLALVYDKLGRRSDAEAMFAKLQVSAGENVPVLYSMIYAQWGDISRALDWLEVAVRQHDPLLEYIRTASVLDPLRKESRFQAIERKLKFPD